MRVLFESTIKDLKMFIWMLNQALKYFDTHFTFQPLYSVVNVSVILITSAKQFYRIISLKASLRP